MYPSDPNDLPSDTIPTWLSLGGLLMPPLALIGLLWGFTLMVKTDGEKGIPALWIGLMIIVSYIGLILGFHNG
jgi:hypothetical protein